MRLTHLQDDQYHPYGHQRFETAASLAPGLMLLGVGVGMLWSAAGKLEAPAAGQVFRCQTGPKGPTQATIAQPGRAMSD